MNGRSDMHNFRFEHCEIPPVAQGAEFALNDEGVYEVYVNHDDTPQSVEPSSSAAGGEGTSTPGAKGKQKIQHVPSLKEYFTDLDYLLGVCSDGPAKSFAFRRLKYLSSKWSLYCLLNEYQELADMKVSSLCPAICYGIEHSADNVGCTPSVNASIDSCREIRRADHLVISTTSERSIPISTTRQV